MRYLSIIALILTFAGVAIADDPGDPDTVIIGTVFVELGEQFVDLPISIVNDEDVAFYNFPLAWSNGSEGIEPYDVVYHYPLTFWDETFDSILVDEHYIRMLGYGDSPNYLNTFSNRFNCWEIRFAIDNLAPPQIVSIDTTIDTLNGSILFGDVSGTVNWVPVVIPGAIYYGTTTDISDNRDNLPDRVAILQNYPNPFNTSTTIEFAIPEEAEIELAVYNILGQQKAVLLEGIKPAGSHSVIWRADDFPSGIYFARLKCNGYSRNMKMILLK